MPTHWEILQGAWAVIEALTFYCPRSLASCVKERAWGWENGVFRSQGKVGNRVEGPWQVQRWKKMMWGGEAMQPPSYFPMRLQVLPVLASSLPSTTHTSTKKHSHWTSLILLWDQPQEKEVLVALLLCDIGQLLFLVGPQIALVYNEEVALDKRVKSLSHWEQDEQFKKHIKRSGKVWSLLNSNVPMPVS